MNIWRRFLHETSGATAIEFSFILVPFMLFVMGIIEFAIIMYMHGAIEEVTRSTARIAITGGMVGIDPNATRDESIEGVLRARAGNVIIGAGNLNVISTSYASFNDFTSGAGSSGGFGGGNAVVEYEVRYSYQYITPLWALIEAATNDITITSTAFVQNENF